MVSLGVFGCSIKRGWTLRKGVYVYNVLSDRGGSPLCKIMQSATIMQCAGRAQDFSEV